jgi:hypothetical protein
MTKLSPIAEAGLGYRNYTVGAPKQRLMVYNLRATDFFLHPFFQSDGVVGDVISRDLVFESLAFRLRPIAMTDSDLCSIWSTLRTMAELNALTSEALESYEERYRAWLTITDEELRQWWPRWEVEQPKAAPVHTEILGVLTPTQELWDRVFGDGPHSDFKRVYRNKIQDLNPAGRESRQARYGKLLATIKAVRPLIVDLHNDVLTVTTGPADPSEPGFRLNY